LEWFIDQTYKALLQNKEALQWLIEKKGITLDVIKENKIGDVRNGWLSSKVTNKSRGIALKLGLLKEKDGKIYDAFWNRLIFPVYNRGRIVSVWTREWPSKEDSGYKWLGVPASEFIPHKPIAFVENLNCDVCIITESIPDALAFLKVDIPAISLLGSHVSQDNRPYLEKAKAKLYFALDPDNAGQEASYKLAREFKGYVINLGQDKDHDEVLAEKGTQEFKAIVNKVIIEVKYYLDLVIENEDFKEALIEVATLEYTSEREQWLKKISDKHSISVEALRDDLQRIIKDVNKERKPSTDEFFMDNKVKMHPSIDVIDDKLIYGISSGKKPIFISDRKLIQLDEIKDLRYLEDYPQQSNFSKDGIQRYLRGETIDPIQLYNTIRDLLSKHIIFTCDWQIDLTVIWIIGTYVYRCFPLYPYYWVKSPTKRCGKTRLLELMSALCFNSNGVETAPSEAVLYRLPAITGGTLLWDEAERLIKQKELGELISILNTAYRKEGKVSRCEGKDHKVKSYGVYRPVALSGISSLPDTVSDRSLKIELIRKRREEKTKRLQIDRSHDQFQKIRDDLCLFALDNATMIIEAYNEFDHSLIPDDVDDRLRDGFEVMISVATPVLYADANHPVLNQLQRAVEGLSGIRNFDEEDNAFIKAINILKSEIERNGTDYLILKSDQAKELFKSGGIEWVTEDKHAQSILRNYFKVRSETHHTKNSKIRGYKLTKSIIENLYSRYGGIDPEEKSVQSVTN